MTAARKRLFHRNYKLGFYMRIRPLLARLLSDKLYLSFEWKRRFGYWMDWSDPQTYNEKLQWLKVYAKRRAYTQLVDKIAVKEIVSSKIGHQYVIPTLSIYSNPSEIDPEQLPDKFVLKCSHDSGSVHICKNKNLFDFETAKQSLREDLSHCYSTLNKEYPYNSVPRRVFAEQFIESSFDRGLVYFKFFCFDGEPKFLFVASDRNVAGQETRFDFFDMEWKHLPVTNGHPNSPIPPEKPTSFQEMVDIARTLSAGIPHVRIDLYSVNGQVYFGEFTFFHWSGFVPFVPASWDSSFGQYLALPRK